MSDAQDGFVPNPVLSGLIGICPLVAAARTLSEGVAYGLGAAFCAIALGATLPLLKDRLPDRLRAPATLSLSAFLALCYAAVLGIYSPSIAAGLWIYTPLLAVSGLSLSIMRRGAAKERFRPDGRSRFLDVLAEAALFLITAALVGALRELVGLGTLSLPTQGPSPEIVQLIDFAPAKAIISPWGGFILLGFLVAAYRAILRAALKRKSE